CGTGYVKWRASSRGPSRHWRNRMNRMMNRQFGGCMKRVLLSVPVLLLLPALATAQNPAVSPESSEIARARVAAKAHRATRVLGEAVGLDNRPVTPTTAATRATRATPATPNPNGGRATPATPA